MDTPAVPDRDWIEVSDAVIDPARLVERVADPASGATVLFLGTVRDHSPGKPGVTHLEYEAYLEHVEEKIGAVIGEARDRWPVARVAAVHRVGHLDVGVASVGVAVSAGHREEAFAAARYVIDELKARAPIWKKEHWAGGAEWVREDLAHQKPT